MCGKILSDLGAEVIKVEPPAGSSSRKIGPFYKDIPDPEKSLFWFAYNTNKKSITLDIEKAEGKEIFRQLVRRADFVAESFPPGHMEGLGLGYETLRQINNQLIMTSITPFGQSGPHAHFRASDLIPWAMSGFMYVCSYPDRPPVWISFPQASLHGGAEAASASLIALWIRNRTGEGDHVDVSMQECVTNVLMNAVQFWDLVGVDVPRSGNAWAAKGIKTPLGWRCKDGYVEANVLGGVHIRSNRAIVAWMAEEGVAPEWLMEFNWEVEFDSTRVSQETVDKVSGELQQFFLTKTKQELWEAALERDFFLAPIYDASEIATFPQLEARRFWTRVPHPELNDTLTYCHPPNRMSETPCEIRRRAPLLGEDNEDIYMGMLGLSREELVRLNEGGVI